LRDRITGSSVRLSRVWRKSDALIIDLEDSVPDAEKPRARGTPSSSQRIAGGCGFSCVSTRRRQV
jgi:hypothetical protein